MNNEQVVQQLEQNLYQLKQKIEFLSMQQDEVSIQELEKLMQDIREIQHIDEFANMELDFDQPRIRKDAKTSSEKKLERKRARLQRSKQTLNQFKKHFIQGLIAIQNFVKNPDNIAKIFVIAVSCFFVSSYLQIPDMSNRHKLYLLEWLAYNRSSRIVLISGSFCLVSITWYMILLIWIACIGFNESKGKLQTLLHECNPLLQLTLIFMTDTDLINNKFDLAVWFCYLFQFSTFKVYNIHSMQLIKKTLSNIQIHTNLDIIKQINKFALFIICMNSFITIFGILLLHKVGYYVLFFLFFGGITTFVEYIKVYLVGRQLLKKSNYFINSNIDQLSEPQFYQELIPDAIVNLLQVIYCIQLIVNYVKNITMQIILHLWLFYIFSSLQCNYYLQVKIEHLDALRICFEQFYRHRKIQNNLDQIFPKNYNIQPDEICAICHDELLVARQLPCQHIFHLKCIFNWLKSEQQCPICRADVPIIDEQPFLLVRILNALSSISLSNITILFQARQQN